ncbi:LysR substrate-binding domain-containing protein [uncultured Cohaesibacter sp.]|uniref:LysR substrate-binding domain-containing protein n=1 Tax=uncultured Cohaesibacter sp. TaxID=1002546 RepID=UPI002AAC1CD6|nr:LysR substrate-binding domain-containing protein [uncultured Cohaesibacter sp.]
MLPFMHHIQQRQIEAFRAVMIAGSISAAAANLNITQPAVSRLIRDLEAEIGFLLFNRVRGRLVPRTQASKLFHEVERVFVGLDHISRVAQDINAESEGFIRLGTVSSLNKLCASVVLPEVLAAHPRLSVIFDTESTERVLDLVSLRHYDIGLICSEYVPTGLFSVLLGRGDAVAVVAVEHPLAQRESVSMEDLSKERLILPGRTSPLRLSLEKTINAADINTSNSIEASLANGCRLASSNLGVTITDPLVAKTSSAKVKILKLEPAMSVSYQLVRLEKARPTGPSALFEASFKKAIENLLN